MTELVHGVLERAAAQVPAAAALASADGASIDFADLDRLTRSLAGVLARHTRPGDRVAVLADNSCDYVALSYAVPRAGRVLALVNQRLHPREQLAQLEVAEPAVVLGDPGYLDALPEPRSHLTGVRQVAPLASVVENAAAEVRGAEEGDTDAAGSTDTPPLPMADDPAWLLFTSGSTGRPKGVVHTHRSIIAAVRGTVSGRFVTRGVYLFPFPLCHVAGYNVLVHHTVASTVVVMPHFRADEFVALVNRHGVTSCSLAPTMLHALLAHVEQTGTSMPTLRSIAYGSAAITAELIGRAADLLAVEFHQGYGMTETAGNVTFLTPEDHRRGLAGEPGLLRTAGRPHAAVEVGVVDDDGQPLPTGGTGEIVVRGAQVTIGYWRDDEATAAARVGDWWRTGDVGCIDADGRLMVVDRRKDIIITGGENVSAREIEDVLATHPHVAAVSVVGVPDAYWGEAICAVVVPADDAAPRADDLIAHVRGRLSPFKRPRHVLLIDALPMTGTGKVAKDVVRRLARDRVQRRSGAEPAGVDGG